MEKKPLSMHEKVLLAVVVVAALVVSFYMLIYKPQREDIAKLTNEVQTKENEVKQYANFDQVIAQTNLATEEYNAKIKAATTDWHSELLQDRILRNLSTKINNSALCDASIEFLNTQIAQIASMTADEDEVPTLAEALAIGYMAIVQDESNKAGSSPAANTADTIAEASPSPSPAASESKSDSGNELLVEIKEKKKSSKQEIDSNVQKRFDELTASMNAMSEQELKQKVSEIIHNTVANIQKSTVIVEFNQTSYQSILDFMHSVEADNPSIYISEVVIEDETESFLDDLKSNAENEHEMLYGEDGGKPQQNISENGVVETVSIEDIFEGTYPPGAILAKQLFQTPSAKKWQKSKDTLFYNGYITLTYFAISDIPGNELPVE